jgi:hypothetical protein
MNILDNKFGFMDIDHIAPFYIDKLPWWEFEEYIKRLNDRIERENKQNKESQQHQQKQSNIPDYSNKLPNVDSMMKNLGKYKP